MEQIRLGLRVYNIIHPAASAAKLLQRAAENFCAGSQVAPCGAKLVLSYYFYYFSTHTHARSGGGGAFL
jgi:hypothetical protein